MRPTTRTQYSKERLHTMRHIEYDPFYTSIVLDQPAAVSYGNIISQLVAVEGTDHAAAEMRKQLLTQAQDAAKALDFSADSAEPLF